MKNLLLFIVFLVCSLANAQDYTFIQRSKALSNQDDALQFSRLIASNSVIPLRLYKSKEITKQNKFKAFYVPVHVKDSDIENSIVSDSDKQNFVTVLFNIDKDKKYRLLEVESKYDVVFPIWQKYYNPKSDKLEDTTKDIYCILQKQGDNWIIRS